MGTDEKDVEKRKDERYKRGEERYRRKGGKGRENGELGTKDVTPPPLRTHSLAQS